MNFIKYLREKLNQFFIIFPRGLKQSEYILTHSEVSITLTANIKRKESKIKDISVNLPLGISKRGKYEKNKEPQATLEYLQN